MRYFCPMSALLAPRPIHPVVVQHNALVNARFNLGELEGRLFLALLSRVGRADTQFAACRVPVTELVLEQNSSHSVYTRVKQMLKEFSQRSVLITKPYTSRRPRHQPAEPDYKAIPLLAYAEYCGGEGEIEARFNDLLLPYLLELRDNFTKAELLQLMKLKSPVAHRLYWLLREYAGLGTRTIALSELKEVLGLAEASAYERWDNFKTRVLDKAQAELAATDLPFTYEVLKARSNGPVQELRFAFAKRASLPVSPPPTTDPETWQARVLGLGIAPKSLQQIEAQLATQRYDEGYIHFVIARVQQDAQVGKVKKISGAVYKAITEEYLLPDYRHSKVARTEPAKQSQKGKRAPDHQVKKLQSELEDLHNSYRFAQTASCYTAAQRPGVLAKIQADIAAAEARLKSVTA